jgi:hypothetical protein
MLFVFNANGVPISGIPSRVFQGSNRANSIYFVCPTSPTNLVNVAFKLPNGVVTTPYVLSLENGEGLKGLCDSDQNVPYVWRAEIPSAVTQYAGTVTAQFVVTAQGGQKITTEGIEFTVEKGVPALEPEKGDSYQELLNYLANNINPPLQQLTLSIGDKVDKQTNTGQLSVYTFMGQEQGNLAVNKTPTPNTIPLFDESAKLHSTETTDSDTNDTVATKGFVVRKNTEQDAKIQGNTLSLQQLQEKVNSLGNVFVLKGSVPTFNDLPSGASIGDVYYVVDESVGYIWLNDGTTNRWEKFGSEGSITFTIDKEINAESTNPVENQAIAKALDNKLDKKTTTHFYGQVPYQRGSSQSGTLNEQLWVDINSSVSANSLAWRNTGGALRANTPSDNSGTNQDLINREFFNENLAEVSGGEWIDCTVEYFSEDSSIAITGQDSLSTVELKGYITFIAGGQPYVVSVNGCYKNINSFPNYNGAIQVYPSSKGIGIKPTITEDTITEIIGYKVQARNF